MAVPSSSSCEVVDLALAASCNDDATSQLFFSKGGGGGGDLSWPAAAEIESKLTKQDSLVILCDNYGVPREFKPVCADTLRCGVCEAPPQGSNALCVYSDALDAGLRFPLHDFYLKLLRHYRLAPTQLVPNAWKYMAAFVLRCKDAGVQPLVSAFRYFFSLYAHYKHKDEPTGWHHFQPCAGRPRLFSGTLPTRHDWKARFFFLKSPDGMPWKCPLAWGKPRMEDARTVELTDAAIDKLKQMPCIDLKYYLSLHAAPVGALPLLQLQLHSTPTPIVVKPECGAASARALALTSQPQLHAALEAGADAAGEGDDTTPRKRRCPGPSPAAVMPQSSTISAAPPSLHGMEITPSTSFDGASVSSGISLPPGTSTRNADFEQRDNQIAQLQFKLQESEAKLRESEAKLRESEAVSDKFFEYLYKERARLIEEQTAVVARVKAERAVDVAKLQEEHVSAVAHLTKQLNEEHAASIARLKEEHAADLARVMDAAEKKVQDVMKNVVRSLYPEADLSLLEGPKRKRDLNAAGTSEAEGRSGTS